MHMTEHTTRKERIPLVLQRQPRWITWKLARKPGGKLTKVPDRSTINLEACDAWDEVKTLPRESAQGIGFVTTGAVEAEHNGEKIYVLALDLDACLTDVLVPWAQEIYDHYNRTYTEITPSGYGVRIWLAVRKLPGKLGRVKVPVAEDSPPGVAKKAELQIFGLGVPQYVTVTGVPLDDCRTAPVIFDDLDWLVDRFGLREGALRGRIEMPVGDGDAPAMSTILDRVERQPSGRDLIDGHWKRVLKRKSASEAFHVLAGHALRAAEGHGAAAAEFLLGHTAWGDGRVDDSADATKYTRASWVERDVMRAAAKTTNAAAVFDALPSGDDGMPGTSPEDVIERWREEGPLHHEPTGIAALDEATGGGPTFPCRVYINGGPDAGKTALVTQIVDTYAQRGIVCGMFAIDEEDGDLMGRLMQRRGWMRTQCEERDAVQLDEMKRQVADLPIRFYGPEFTVEAAAAALRQRAGDRRAVLVVDSLQTATCEQEQNEKGSRYENVTERVAALRAVADRFRLMVLVTSEMSRAAYRDPDKRIDDMASGKESGAIEYSARVLLAMRAVPGEVDLTEVRVVKNKLGPRTRGEDQGILLRIDRGRQTLTEDNDTEIASTSKEAENTARVEKRKTDDALALVKILRERQGVGTRDLRALMSATLPGGCSKDRTEVACVMLGDALTRTPGAGNSKHHYLDETKLPWVEDDQIESGVVFEPSTDPEDLTS